MQTILCYPGWWLLTKYKEKVTVIRRPSDWNLVDKRFQYTISSRVSLYKRWRSETSQKAIKIHWQVITKSCTNWKSVQQGLTSVPRLHSSRVFRHENRTTSEVNRKKIELKSVYLVQAELLQKASTYQAGTCCFCQNPVLMRSFFRKLSTLKAHTLARAESESLEEWGSFQLGSVNSKLLKTPALPLPSWRGDKKRKGLLPKAANLWWRKASKHTLCTPNRQATRSTTSTHWSTSQAPLTCPAALRQHHQTREFQLLQWNKYIGQPYGSFCLLCCTAHAGKKPFRETAAVTAIHCR